MTHCVEAIATNPSVLRTYTMEGWEERTDSCKLSHTRINKYIEF